MSTEGYIQEDSIIIHHLSVELGMFTAVSPTESLQINNYLNNNKNNNVLCDEIIRKTKTIKLKKRSP